MMFCPHVLVTFSQVLKSSHQARTYTPQPAPYLIFPPSKRNFSKGMSHNFLCQKKRDLLTCQMERRMRPPLPMHTMPGGSHVTQIAGTVADHK